MQCSTLAVARWTVDTTATVSCHYPPSDAVLTEPMEISRSEPLKMVQNFIFVLDQTDTGSPVNAWPEWSARKRQTGCETLAFYTMSLGVISPWITCGFSFLHLACAQWIFTWADWYRWMITFLLISSRDFMSINVIFLYLRGRLTCFCVGCTNLSSREFVYLHSLMVCILFPHHIIQANQTTSRETIGLFQNCFPTII